LEKLFFLFGKRENRGKIFFLQDFCRKNYKNPEQIRNDLWKSGTPNKIHTAPNPDGRVGNRPAIDGKCRHFFEIADISQNTVGSESQFFIKNIFP